MNTAGRIAAFTGGAIAGAGVNWLINKIPPAPVGPTPDTAGGMDFRPLIKVAAGSGAIVYGKDRIGIEAAAGMAVVPLFSAFGDYQALPQGKKELVGLAMLAALAGVAFVLTTGKAFGEKE
jgi:hypothetical protein